MDVLKRIILVTVLAMSSMIAQAQTKIVAHRGFSHIAPENTLSAFQKAIDSKADYFELDVHKTKDNVVIVIHDATVDKTTSNEGKGAVAEMTYDELTGVKVGFSTKFGDAYKNERIPTLREALELAKGKIKVCIEIKVLGVEAAVLKIVNDLGVKNEVIIFSFYYPVLAKIRQLDKEIPILYLIGKADETTIDYAKVIQANAIGVGYETIVSKDFIQFAHNSGVEVWKWTVNEESEMKLLMKLGLDGLITDMPDKAVKMQTSLK